MTLRVLAPEMARPIEFARPKLARLARQEPPPLPLNYHHSEHRGDRGPYVDTTIVWSQEDGLRCRFCPAGTCTLSVGREGIAVCVIRRDGELGTLDPSPLSRPAG